MKKRMGEISNLAEYVFTEWDRSASDDMEAMRRVFDTNGDGKLNAEDARWGEFRVMVTHADGTTTTQSLSELGITAINLRPDVTRITLPDGSQITGQTSFTMNGTQHTAANTTLALGGPAAARLKAFTNQTFLDRAAEFAPDGATHGCRKIKLRMAA